VLLIKTAWGGKSLSVDFKPPSSGGTVGPFYTRMIEEVKEVISNLKQLFPDAPAKYELSGFFWHQGWNDACLRPPAPDQYKIDLPNLINDIQKDLSGLSGAANGKLLVTVGVSGMGGYRPYSDKQCTGALDVLTNTIIPAQFSVADVKQHPEFAGSVSSVETRHFHREAQYSPGGQCYHWNNNGESYWRVGDAMGTSMLSLLSSPQAGGGFVSAGQDDAVARGVCGPTSCGTSSGRCPQCCDDCGLPSRPDCNSACKYCAWC